MAGTVFEWYGFPSTDASPQAATASANGYCPFLQHDCTKANGVCTVTPTASQDNVVICPIRLYYDHYHFLERIARSVFSDFQPAVNHAGFPQLVNGDQAVAVARESGVPQVGVFGKGWGGEIKLPPAVPGAGRYSVDFTLVCVDGTGSLVGFVPVEVQTIDTTNSYSASVTALRQNRDVVQSGFGLNWENVNKRILPQLIVKGLMLQAERRCQRGMFFVTPEPVFQRVMLRLGGVDRLRRIPQQPGSITFIRYQHDVAGATPATPIPLAELDQVTVSTSDLSLAFITPENLPAAGAYEVEIMRKL